ncbi:hypothetical protein VTL71DRAFT_8565 [Oculimacula yallundae]|uniref:DUF4440 domain-containing protein n=1 Tax=Oculimacula yallundae TaxID=86028 RepID=A0ABR4CY47_9HELO
MSTQHSYQSALPPGINLDDGIRAFFETFYKTSDTPDAHDAYADSFTEDADFVMASKRARGREEILAIREGMWTTVSSRLHTPVKIFPFGSGADELMLYGTVKYVLKDGRGTEVEWAARAKMAKVEGEWKMAFYQVYLDTAAMQNAK